jgi:hypothetical protein
MAKMRFDVKCVRDCLVTNGVVFTVRSWGGYGVMGIVEVSFYSQDIYHSSILVFLTLSPS